MLLAANGPLSTHSGRSIFSEAAVQRKRVNLRPRRAARSREQHGILRLLDHLVRAQQN